MIPPKKALKRLNMFRRNKSRFDKPKEDRVPLTCCSEETVCSELTDDSSVSSKSYSCDPFEWSKHPKEATRLHGSTLRSAAPESEPITEDEESNSESEHEEKAPTRPLKKQRDSLLEATEFPEFSTPVTRNQNSHIKISILLLHPEEKNFELIQVKCSAATPTVRDVLYQIPNSTTEPSLAFQPYSGLCYSEDGANITDEGLKAVGEDTVLLAVPEKYSSGRITAFGKQILASRSMTKVMRKLKQRLSLRRSSSPKRSTTVKHYPMATVDMFSSKPDVAASAYEMALNNDDMDVFPPEQDLSTLPEELVTALLLLLDPRSRTFELIQVKYSLSSSSILDVLGRVPYIATRPELGCLRYVGLCNPVDKIELTDESLEVSRQRTVLVAIPKGFTSDKIAAHGAQILSSSRVAKALSQLGLEVPSVNGDDKERSTASLLKSHRQSDSLSVTFSTVNETDSVPAVIATRSLDTTCDSSVSVISHRSMTSCNYSLPYHNLYKKVHTASPARALKNHKSKRARRSQRQAFAIRAAFLVVSVMAIIFMLDPSASSGVAQHAIGLSGFLQAFVFLWGMAVVQRMTQHQMSRQARTTSPRAPPPPKHSVVPGIVVIDTDNDGFPLVVR